MQHSLDVLLRQAAAEPASRPAFFRQLLTATVWVVARDDSGQRRFDADFRYDLEGHAILPFFSSETALKQVLGAAQPRTPVYASQLFRSVDGQTLCLNPGLSEGKVFTATEIRELLNTEGNVLAGMEPTTDTGSLLLSAVEQPDPQLLASLSALFRQEKTVKRAFLAFCRETADGEGNLLIGIEAGEGIEQVIQAAGQVALDTLPQDTLIDICEVRGQEDGVSHFFSAHISPFYQRPHGSFLRGVALTPSAN